MSDDVWQQLLTYIDPVWCLLPLLFLVFFISRLISLDRFGLVPRRLSGLSGIVMMMLLHDDMKHLFANVVPLIVLLALLLIYRLVPPWVVVVLVQVCGGAALWMIGRRANHIGASLLVFGLVGFHMANGYFQSNVANILIALVVAVLYGGTFLSSVVPWRQGSSWDGHLCGFVAGVGVAYALAHESFQSYLL